MVLGVTQHSPRLSRQPSELTIKSKSKANIVKIMRSELNFTEPNVYVPFFYSSQGDVVKEQLTSLQCHKCMVITYSRVRVDRVRLPILLVVSSTGKIATSPFPPEDLVSRDRFGRPAPRQPAYYLHSG